MQNAESAQDTGNELVTCVINSIFGPVLGTDAVFGPARMTRRGSFCRPRHRVVIPTALGYGGRTNSFVPGGTFAGSSNPPLETVGCYRASLRDRRSSASCGADISNRTKGREDGNAVAGNGLTRTTEIPESRMANCVQQSPMGAQRQSARGQAQSKPWRIYGAPFGGRACLGTSPEGERGGRRVGGSARNSGVGMRFRFA